jgi:hypothetical protein
MSLKKEWCRLVDLLMRSVFIAGLLFLKIKLSKEFFCGGRGV